MIFITVNELVKILCNAVGVNKLKLKKYIYIYIYCKDKNFMQVS